MDAFRDAWSFATGAVALAATVAALAHLLLKKRDSRSAVAWAGLVLLLPGLGAFLYYVLGINRVARRAGRLEGLRPRNREGVESPDAAGPAVAKAALPRRRAYLERIAARVDAVASLPLVPGNAVTPLDGGEAAYAAMLDAIEAAETSVAVAGYIFRHDGIGTRFADALADAHDRGVAVRVLLDGVGSWTGVLRDLGLIYRRLRRARVPVALFLYSLVPWRMTYLNLRNHAKILVVDGRVGFTGGLNIQDDCLLETAGARGIADVHFRLEGPVVGQTMARFAADWHFTTGETLTGEAWFPEPAPAGPMTGRGIESGPDFEENPLRWTLLSAIGAARERIRIATPYFLPDETVLSALRLAAAGGVTVDLLLPERLDTRLLQWASAVESEIAVEAGCRVSLTPVPFDHAKLMTVDGAWALIGSGNWDMRSLRLNFEYVAEWYDRGLAGEIDALIDARMARGRRLTAEELAARPVLARLRDGAAHLLHPYL